MWHYFYRDHTQIRYGDRVLNVDMLNILQIITGYHAVTKQHPPVRIIPPLRTSSCRQPDLAPYDVSRSKFPELPYVPRQFIRIPEGAKEFEENQRREGS